MNVSDGDPSPRLAAQLEAARAVPSAAEAAAQQRLLARLAQRPARRTQPSRWIALAAGVALAAVLLSLLPLLRGEGQAFAAVQAHFRAFRTLGMTIEQRQGEALVQRTQVWLDAQGRIRTDIGPQLSVVVDRPRGRVLSLLHETRQASLAPFSPAATAAGGELDWLEELRRFQGDARRLDARRAIGGAEATGWELSLGGQRLVLWAGADGLPLAMEHDVPGGLRLDYHFEFDGPLPEGGLSSEVPAGYTEVAADPD